MSYLPEIRKGKNCENSQSIGYEPVDLLFSQYLSVERSQTNRGVPSSDIIILGGYGLKKVENHCTNVMFLKQAVSPTALL